MMSIATFWLPTSLLQCSEDIALEALGKEPALWGYMIVLGNLTWWGSQWLVPSLAYPAHFQDPQAS